MERVTEQEITEMEKYRTGEIQRGKGWEHNGRKEGRKEAGREEGPFYDSHVHVRPTVSTACDQALCGNLPSQARNTWCEYPNSLPRTGYSRARWHP